MKLLKWLFSCKHPAYWLRWDRDTKPTVEPIDQDFEDHIMLCHCDKCGSDVTLNFTQCRGGVDAFMRRAESAASRNPNRET